MKRKMMLTDWIDKTIKNVEVKNISFMNSNDVYLIHFTDGTQAEINAYVVVSPSRQWNDTAELKIIYEDNKNGN